MSSQGVGSSDDASLGAGDGFAAGDDSSKALASRAGLASRKANLSCDEELAEPAGYVSFAQDEFASENSALRIETSLDVEPKAGAFFRVYVTSTTQLAQKHHSIDVAIAAGEREQSIEIPFADLKLQDLVEQIGTLAVTVELHEGAAHTTLHRAGRDGAAGLHLNYHLDSQGRVRAYVPELRARKYAAEWKQGLERRLSLHTSHAFASLAEAVDHDVAQRAAARTTFAAVAPALVTNNVRFCPRMTVEYVDVGQGEDYWTESGAHARPMYGAQLKVKQNGTLLETLNLSEDDGCLNFHLDVGTTYDIEIWAIAKIWDNTYTVQDVTGHTRFNTYTIKPTTTALTTFEPNLTDSGAPQRWNIFEALIRSGRKHGVGSGNTYLFRYDPSIDSFWGSGEGHIGDTQSGHKFIVAHEYGHGLQEKITGSTFPSHYDIGEDTNNDGKCDVNPAPDMDCRSGLTGVGACIGGSHKLWSLEYQAAAANEGWAHFVSADVWNDHATDDCSFGYWRTKGLNGYNVQSVDCENGTTDFPVKFMQNECDTNSGDWSKMGVEIDWLRTFWDVHTNGANPPGMSTLLDLLNVSGVNDTNAKSKLDAKADSMGGVLNTNWDTASSGNGL